MGVNCFCRWSREAYYQAYTGAAANILAQVLVSMLMAVLVSTSPRENTVVDNFLSAWIIF